MQIQNNIHKLQTVPVCVCVCVCVCFCTRVYARNTILWQFFVCFCFNECSFVDLVKHSVLTLVSEIRHYRNDPLLLLNTNFQRVSPFGATLLKHTRLGQDGITDPSLWLINTRFLQNHSFVPVCSVSRAKCIVDIDITKLWQGAAKFLDLVRGGLDLAAIRAHPFAFLFHVEPQVFQKNDSTARRLLTLALHIWPTAVLQESHLAAWYRDIYFNDTII